MEGVVLCKLPKAGLGNQLFPLMKAYTFAHLNNLPVIVTNYNRVKIGPYLRREKKKRNYAHFFTFQKNILGAQVDKWKLKKYKDDQQVIEPVIKVIDKKEATDTIYAFSAMPHWDNYFDGLKENRDIVIRLFSEVINPRIKKKVTELPQPCIAVHIRMGDFRKLKQDEDFSKVGAVRTPENYFIETINSIRKIHGTDLPVSVFTDGYPNEFKNLFTLKNISMVEGDNDLADLLLLSKSKIIITSAGSTFGYWAGFLSNASVILHPAHATTVIRGSDGNNLYEGSFDAANPVLVESIRGL